MSNFDLQWLQRHQPRGALQPERPEGVLRDGAQRQEQERHAVDAEQVVAPAARGSEQVAPAVPVMGPRCGGFYALVSELPMIRRYSRLKAQILGKQITADSAEQES